MYSLAVHGGAGTLSRAQLSAEREQAYRQGLAAALSAGQAVLEAQGCALDAVQAAVTTLEDDELFNAGRGAVLTADGTVELDAAIMDGTQLRAGAVALLRRVKNPVQLARRILEESPHVFLAAEGAERFAQELGLSMVANEYFITPYRQEQLAALQRQWAQALPADAASRSGAQNATLDEPHFGTVGAVARDHSGRLAAATSTGGTAGKRAGRIGDSPVIGAGTYADDRSCAVSTTGHGEWFLRTVQAYDIVARLRYGAATLPQATTDAITHRLATLGAAGGLIAVDSQGEIAICYNTPAMFRASIRSGETARIGIY
jgi:beta-aspartyl-peptidase (threonine type)